MTKDEAYKAWWHNEGSGIIPKPNEDMEEFAHRITQIAWSNGAFKEREQILFAIKEVRGRSQEPVAWMFQHEETGRTVCIDAQQLGWGFEKGNPRLKKIAPLYTTPPHRPWVGLTDEERNAIFELHHTRLGGWDYRGDEVMYDEHFEDATVAIYAKLKQKNGIKE